MSLLSDLVEAELSKTSYCAFGRIRNDLSEEDRALLDTMLSDLDRFTLNLIARVLTDSGHDISRYAVAYHVQGRCKCPR